jgi:hypothetical protein
MGTTMADQQDQIELKEQLLAVLLEKIDADPYPSASMMDLAEQLLTPRTLPVYAQVLMRKIRQDTFPSVDMMKRVTAMV